jgi:hypothetical protein
MIDDNKVYDVWDWLLFSFIGIMTLCCIAISIYIVVDEMSVAEPIDINGQKYTQQDYIHYFCGHPQSRITKNETHVMCEIAREKI